MLTSPNSLGKALSANLGTASKVSGPRQVDWFVQLFCLFVNLTKRSQPPTSGSAWNVILAISAQRGVVAYWVFEGTTNKAVFQVLLTCMLFPALADGGPKVIMWDNLSSHLTRRVRDSVSSAGHSCISRPTHSPDFAPVENCFGEMDQSGEPKKDL